MRNVRSSEPLKSSCESEEHCSALTVFVWPMKWPVTWATARDACSLSRDARDGKG